MKIEPTHLLTPHLDPISASLNWQEETVNAGLPTTDHHQKLRLRIDKYLSADRQQKRKKALETRYPLVYLQTDPAGDWPGREEDDLEPGAWRSAAERNMMFSLCGWSEASQAELKLYVPTLAVVEGGDEGARNALRSLECVDASFQQRLQQVARAWDVTPTMHGGRGHRQKIAATIGCGGGHMLGDLPMSSLLAKL